MILTAFLLYLVFSIAMAIYKTKLNLSLKRIAQKTFLILVLPSIIFLWFGAELLKLHSVWSSLDDVLNLVVRTINDKN